MSNEQYVPSPERFRFSIAHCSFRAAGSGVLCAKNPLGEFFPSAIGTERGCVEDQPQRVESSKALGTCSVLRMVEDDTAALRSTRCQARSNQFFWKLTRRPVVIASLVLMAMTAASSPSFQLAACCLLIPARCFSRAFLSLVSKVAVKSSTAPLISLTLARKASRAKASGVLVKGGSSAPSVWAVALLALATSAMPVSL